MVSSSSTPSSWPVFSIAFLGVALTLQLIWLVITPLGCQVGARVNLPFAASARHVAGTERDLTISIKSDGSCFLGQTWVPIAAFADALAQMPAASERRIVIKADAAASFGTVRAVMRALQAAGFDRAELVTFEGQALEAYRRGGDA